MAADSGNPKFPPPIPNPLALEIPAGITLEPAIEIDRQETPREDVGLSEDLSPGDDSALSEDEELDEELGEILSLEDPNEPEELNSLGDIEDLGEIEDLESEEPTDPGIITPPPMKAIPVTQPRLNSKVIPLTAITSKSQPPRTPPPSTSSPNSTLILAPTPTYKPKATATPTFTSVPINLPELGILESLMRDNSISEILINDLRNVMIERNGKLEFSGIAFSSIDELNRLTRTLLELTGLTLGPENPSADLTLADGSRIHIVVPPLTREGPCLSIRKFSSQHFNINDLMHAETIDRRIAHFLNACVKGKTNILISGAPGSGKTTLLNALIELIPVSERIVSIEDAPELRILHSNSVKLHTKPQTSTSRSIGSSELIVNAIRMRPDRIILAECHAAETFEWLQAINEGYLGSMTTIYANSPEDALFRLETLSMNSESSPSEILVRRNTASTIDLIVHIKRFPNGHRKVISLTEITGIEDGNITTQNIFNFECSEKAENKGFFRATGFIPKLITKLSEHGINFPKNYFDI